MAKKPTKPTKPADNADNAAAYSFRETVRQELGQALADTLARLEAGENRVKAAGLIGQLADLSQQACDNPDKAEQIKADAAHVVSTLATLGAIEAAQVREAWRQAAWRVAQSAAHAAVAVVG